MLAKIIYSYGQGCCHVFPNLDHQNWWLYWTRSGIQTININFDL